MTTPKNQKPVYTNQPNYMFPDLQGLPEEFRRLAAEARAKREESEGFANYYIWDTRSLTFDEAAQMLEERLNG